MTYGNTIILAGSDVTEEGWYWRTPGIPVMVKRRPDGRLWFHGFGLIGPVDDHEFTRVLWCGPMVAPLPIQGDGKVSEMGNAEVLVNALDLDDLVSRINAGAEAEARAERAEKALEQAIELCDIHAEEQQESGGDSLTCMVVAKGGRCQSPFRMALYAYLKEKEKKL